MPQWAGTWKGGRYYLNDEGKRVYFIERRVLGQVRSIKLKTHDRQLALGELARFLADPIAFVKPPPEAEAPPAAVLIDLDRVKLYMASIENRVLDYREAKRKDLHAWASYRDAKGQPLDLRTVDMRALRSALESFAPDPKGTDKRKTGAFKRRAESLNCFANFLVAEGELKFWNPLRTTPSQKPAERRAEREAYSLEDVQKKWKSLPEGPARDVLMVRASTGMHHTEIEQLHGCKIYSGPLPDKGVGIRKLGGDHEIQGVIQFRQKTKPRHRVSVSGDVLDAVLRLRESGVPTRKQMWTALAPLVPSNLRHTWVTLCGEVGEEVTYKSKGIPLDRIQAIGGHRIGSSITEMSYDKLQVPPMSKLPFDWS